MSDTTNSEEKSSLTLSQSLDEGGAVKKQISDFTIQQALGDGAFGTVNLAIENCSNKQFAIKCVSKALIVKEKKIEAIKREKHILNELKCLPSIINLYSTFQDKDTLYFALEYCPNGDLLEKILEYDGLGIACVQFYAAQLIEALCCLHQRNIAHRDLKPENVMLTAENHIKLIDFGTAIHLSNASARSSSFVGTAEYVPPELLIEGSRGTSGDLWALGCVIYQMIVGAAPFRSSSDWLTFQNIKERNIVFHEQFPAEAKDLISKLLSFNTNESSRLGSFDPELKDIKAHPFFKGIEWGSLFQATAPPFCSAELSLKVEQTEGDDEDKQEEASATSTADQEARKQKMEEQQQTIWGQFLIPDSELIVKMGLVSKKKGLFPRKRQLILTDLPRLIYVDPDSLQLKGEIPWSDKLAIAVKNSKLFYIKVPGRVYNLEDLEGNASEWAEAIKKQRKLSAAKLLQGL